MNYKEVEYAQIVTGTPFAYLMEFPDGSEEWLPKSQVSIISGDDFGGYVSVPEWLLIEKQIDYD